MPKKRTMIYSNVKQNKKKAEEISRIKDDQINLDDEIFIGLSNDISLDKEQEKSNKKKNGKKIKKKKIKIKKNKQNKQIDDIVKPQKVKTKKIKIKKKPKVKKQEVQDEPEEFVFKETRNNPGKKKKLSKIKVSILFIIIIGGIVAFLSSPIFKVKEIRISISNAKHLTEEEINILTDINVGENIFSMSRRHIKNGIEKNPYVQSAKVTRKYPDKIFIEVTERSVKFQLKKDDKFVHIDGQGYIMDEADERAEGIVLITGYTSEQFVSGERLNDKDLEKLSDVIQILQEAQNNEIADKIKQIDITDNDDYKLYFDDDGKVAYVGNIDSINDKMAYIKKILEMESDYEGEIFVNVNLSGGEYPYFREKV